MKGTIKSGGLAALTISALLTMNCTSDKTSEGYIGPSQIEIKDGKMTPRLFSLSEGCLTRSSPLTGKPFSTV